MKSNKNEILKLYFESKLKQVEIAGKLNISKNAVSKILKLDERYQKEKDYRKQLNKKKHNKQIQNNVEQHRKIKQSANELDYYILKSMHEQASKELSGGRKPISDRAYRDWNSSAYKYNENSKCYVLKKGINVGADVPKRVNWK